MKQILNVLIKVLAVIGLYSIFSWLWYSYVYGIHTNSVVEDITVISANDTIAHYTKMPPGTIRLDFARGTLTVNHRQSTFEYPSLPDGSKVEIVSYEDGLRNGSTILYTSTKCD